TAGYKLDFFKGMSYDEIRLIFQARFDANMRFLFKSRYEMEEEDREKPDRQDAVWKSQRSVHGLALVKRWRIQVAQKKFKKAFENVDSSSRVELIPSKIKYAIKVVLSFHKEFLVFSSLSRKENDGLLQRSRIQE
nr:hypothetical protein [Tanacetum cinerariifolium]